MRINDGYTVVACRAGVVFECRPMLHAERMAVLSVAKTLAGDSLRRYLQHHARDHVDCGFEFLLRRGEDFHWAYRLVIGHGQRQQEQLDVRNLYEGTRLKLLYPHLGRHTCAYCQKWWFDPATGETFAQDKKPIERTEEELLCKTETGCPLGTPEKQRTFSEKNQRAFEFDLHCRATGSWPDDPIVKRNAYVIGMAAKRVHEGLNGRVRPRQRAGA